MSKLAIIYKSKQDYFFDIAKFYCACTITTKAKDNSICVLDGEFKDKDDSYFGIIEGDPEFVYLNTRSTFTINKKSESNYYMFIFENKFIDEFAEEYNINQEEAIDKIIYNASLAYFEMKKDNKLKIYYSNESKLDKKDGNDFSKFEKYLISNSTALINYPLSAFVASTVNYDEKIKHAQEKAKEYVYQGIDIKETIDTIGKKIIEQDKAIKTLVCNINFNQRLIDSLSEEKENSNNELDSRKVGILLDGATGVGKTALAKEIASKFNLPIVIANANSFSETGYVGATITDLLEELLKKAKGDIKLAQRGIVVLDEVDKIAKRNEYDQTSMKLGVQKELLGFMSGGTYEIETGLSNIFMSNKVKFDTSKLTFIFAGAFTDMKEEKIEQNNKNAIGFTENENKSNSYKVDTEDYVKFGLMREFFGRIKVISHMKTYTKEDLKNILFKSTISPLKGLEKTCILFGAEGIEYNDEFITSVVEKAYEMGTNARALQSIMSSIQNMILYDLEIGEYIGKKVVLDKTLLEEIEKEKVIEY